jgi:biopolymer transport protein ExbB/TolQ
MILALAKLLTPFGIDITKAQKIVIWALLIIGIIAVLSLGLWVRSCSSRREARLDEKQKVEAAKAIEQKNDAKLKEILVEVEAREATINANVETAHVETHAAIQNAKEKYANMNTDELAAELEKRK